MTLFDNCEVFKPFFSSVRVLNAVLRDYLDNDEYETVLSLIELGSPWQLMEIFLKDRHHDGFVTRNNLNIPNNEICWHLHAIALALEKHTSDLGACYEKKWLNDFHYDGAHGNHKGQGKLFFSLLYFSLATKSQNVVEVGGGCGEGGFNHELVCDVLTELEVSKNFLLIDPLLVESERQIGLCSLTCRASLATASDVYNDPVFCDIYDDLNFGVIQDGISAPVKMLKCLNPLDNQNLLLQPYHTEARIFKNKQFVNVLRSFNVRMPEFDNCSNCVKWKAMAIEFSVSSELLFRHLMRCETQSCTPLVGAGVIRALTKETKRMVELERYLDRDNMYLEPEPIYINHRVKIPSQVYTDWDDMVIKFLELNNSGFSEMFVPSLTIYSLALPALAVHDGVKLYHSYRSVSWLSSSMYLIGFNDDLTVVKGLIELYGYDLVSKIEDEKRFCYLLVKVTHVEHDVPLCLEVGYDTELPGVVKILRCNDHLECDNKCQGLLCNRGTDNFGIWLFNTYIIPVHFVNSPCIALKSVMSILHLYHQASYSDYDCERVLCDLYINRLYTKIFRGGVASLFSQQSVALFALLGADCNDVLSGENINLSYGVLTFGIERCDCHSPSLEIACVRYQEEKVYRFHDVEVLRLFLKHVEVNCLKYIRSRREVLISQLDKYVNYTLPSSQVKVRPHVAFEMHGRRSVSPINGKSYSHSKIKLPRVMMKIFEK